MRVKSVVLFLFFVIVTTIVLYCFMPLPLDGVWNYGFGYNIFKGLVPYKDFNMVVTPFFPYLIAFFLKIMGNNFIVYNILISSLIVGAAFLVYRKMGVSCLFIYFLLLIYPYNGYNLFGIFLLFVLLYLLDKDYKGNDFLIAAIVSLMVLTKQTLVVFLIPSIWYAKNKKKIVCFYLIVGFCFLGYLVINDNLVSFVDYCFLGMVDFSDNTSKFGILSIFEIGLCLYFVIELVGSKFFNKEAFYILLIQVISFPITDGSHFVLTFAPIVYYLFVKYKDVVRFRFLVSLVLGFYLVGCFKNSVCFFDVDEGIYISEGSVFNYKLMSLYMEDYFEMIREFSDSYGDYRLYLFDSRAYLAKMELGMKIDKYDLINVGNMGYNGEYKYVDEIDDYCKDRKCLFIVNDYEVSKDINQTSKYITLYVDENYYKIYSSNIGSVYVN